MSQQREDRATRQERRRARGAFALLLRRLRRMCEVVDQISDWRDVAAEVVELLNTHQAAIPADRERRIRQALELPEITLKGMEQACRVLQVEVEGLIKYLRPVPAAATALVAGVIIVAAGVFVLTVVSNLVAVDIRVSNKGCGDLPVTEVLGIPGNRLLDTALPDILGITLIRVLGVEQRFPAGEVTDVVFDGASLLGVRTLISVAQDGPHELTIKCER